MAIEIRATTVTPNASGALVQLHISDATHPDAVAATSLTLAVQVPAFDGPLLAHLQREAMEIAYNVLGELREQTAREIRNARIDTHLNVKHMGKPDYGDPKVDALLRAPWRYKRLSSPPDQSLRREPLDRTRNPTRKSPPRQPRR